MRRSADAEDAAGGERRGGGIGFWKGSFFFSRV